MLRKLIILILARKETPIYIWDLKWEMNYFRKCSILNILV